MKLCYVDAPWAYFTTQDLDKQWGDDWNDAPYEHNAGEPYEPARPDLPNRATLFPDDWNEDGTPKWKIVKIAFELDWAGFPSDRGAFSVEDINKGLTPWVVIRDTKIMAGTDVIKFIEIIEENGGKVYISGDVIEII